MARLERFVARALDQNSLPASSLGSHCLSRHISCKDNLRSFCADAERYVAVAVGMHLHSTALLLRAAQVSIEYPLPSQGGRYASTTHLLFMANEIVNDS